MNIKITHNWLLEYLDTDATPKEISEYLSLCGPSIESVTKVKNDWVYDIEVISNRIDYASVVGIAREAAAILPRFDKKAKLKKNLDSLHLRGGRGGRGLTELKIIDDDNLCPRKLAVVMDVKTGKSPTYIKERLQNYGIRALNNLIDVTNYVMLETGHPAHVFDFDRIKTGKILIRYAKKGEKIVTLDKKEYQLDNRDVVFDDGTGRIIDLPGIMGLENSVVTDETKKIVFWIETNDPKAIRRTSMKLGIRTIAASINEKNPDPKAARMAFDKGIELYEKIANGKVISSLYDINSEKSKYKAVETDYEIFEKIIGVKIEKEDIDNVLKNLGFEIYHLDSDRAKMVQLKIPSWRSNDISIPEDLVEEVARIYGYHKLPNNLQPPAIVEQPKEFEKLFFINSKVKYFLKHLGLNEVINYSMISKEMIQNSKLKIEEHLKLSSTISEEIEYMRQTLLPSLYKNVDDNTGKKDVLKFFEIAKVYLPRKNELPEETYKLGVAVNTDYFDLKGIIEALYRELNVEIIHELSLPEIIERDGVFIIEIDLQWLIDRYRQFSKYQPTNPYAVIKLDKTFNLSPQLTYEVIRKKAFGSKLLQKIEVVTLFENKLTLRFYYSSSEKNITEQDAKEELNRI